MLKTYENARNSSPASKRSCFSMKSLICRTLLIILLAFVSLSSGPALAHPEDDFCGPDSGIDMQLCRQLSEMNSSDATAWRPLLDESGKERSAFSSAMFFMDIGVRHILPGGTDHILFVLALFLGSQTLRSLITQVSVFTVAHTATLGLTAAGVLNPPETLVETLIALSIALVAIENIFLRDISRWRHLVVFGFGLFHGMGFAGYIGDIGLPPDQFWPSLIGFNIGVEIGQLSVVIAAFFLSLPVKRYVTTTEQAYHRYQIVPFSLIIAMISIWWVVERSLGL